MAKFDLSETETQWVSDAADKLLKSFSALEPIDTAGVLPLVSVLSLENVFREDAVKKSFTRSELLSNAPEQYDGYFQVPKTLD